ncbi:MAG: TolB family protein, partial [Caulobacteraceae bacterium]
MKHLARLILPPLMALIPAVAAPSAVSAAGPFTLSQVLDYPFESDLVAAEKGEAIAWVRNLAGARNVWVAAGPAFIPRQATRQSADDGQELSYLTFTPDGKHLVYVRGGDHDANWPAEGDLAPDPAAGTEAPAVAIWSIALPGGSPVKVTEGDAPAVSARGELAYIKTGQAWTAPLNGKGKAERLFFDRGHDGSLAWSPDGARLA